MTKDNPIITLPPQAWAAFLSEIDQEEDKKELEQICASLVSPDLLDYQDPDIKLFVACCCADVLRIYAPEAPYADDQLKVWSCCLDKTSIVISIQIYVQYQTSVSFTVWL